MDGNGSYLKSKKNPTEDDLLTMFADVKSDIILYGHDHTRNICKGDKLYINAGSLGCPAKDHNIARAAVLNLEHGNTAVDLIDVTYDVEGVIRQMDALNYPDKDNIKIHFYGLS